MKRFRKENVKNKIKMDVGLGIKYKHFFVLDKMDKEHRYKCRCLLCQKEVNIHAAMILSSVSVYGCGCNLSQKQKQWWTYYKTYARSAITRGVYFNLSLKRFIEIVSAPCFYCGSIPKMIKKYHLEANGIDRWHNYKHYTAKDSVPCCSLCNIMKGSLPFKVFKSQVKSIANHLNAVNTVIIDLNKTTTKLKILTINEWQRYNIKYRNFYSFHRPCRKTNVKNLSVPYLFA